MEKKSFIKSKRFWGILVACLGRLLPVINPALGEYSETITTVGGLVFGYGCLDAKKPVKFGK